MEASAGGEGTYRVPLSPVCSNTVAKATPGKTAAEWDANSRDSVGAMRENEPGSDILETLAATPELQFIAGASPDTSRIFGRGVEGGTCSMLSEVSYCSRMAEEARAFAQALTAQEQQQPTQQEDLSTPLQSRLAPQPPGAVQPAQSITASGRKRPRHSLSPADNSSAGEQSALYQQGDDDVKATPGMQRSMALAQEHSLDGILYQSGFGNDDRDLPLPSMERSGIPAYAISPFEPLSRSASASDEDFSPRLEQSGCMAVMAARTVAQVMGMQAGQARLQSELQTMEGDKVALEVQHCSTVARLEESLQENSNLHSVMLEQAREVGALGAAQDAMRRQLSALEDLQALQSAALQHRNTLALHQLGAANSNPQDEPSGSTLQEHPFPSSPCAGKEHLPEHITLSTCQPGTKQLSGLANFQASPMFLSASPIRTADNVQHSELAIPKASPTLSAPPVRKTDNAQRTRLATPKALPSMSASPVRTPLSMHLLGVAHRLNTPQSLAAEHSSPPASRANSLEAAQDAAFQDRESSSDSVERPNPLFNGHSRLNIPQSPAVECPSPAASPAEAFQEAAQQACESSSASVERFNPVFDDHRRLNTAQSLAAERHSSAASPAEASLEAQEAPQGAAHQAWEPSSASANMHSPLFDGESADKYSGKDASAALPAGQVNTEVADTTAIIQGLQQKLEIAKWEAASAKEASAASREALEVSRLEGEELCRQLCEMQERLSTTEAQLQASQKAASSKLDMAEHDETVNMLKEKLRLVTWQAQLAASASSERSSAALAAENAALREDLDLKREQLDVTRLQVKALQMQKADNRLLLEQLEREQSARESAEHRLQRSSEVLASLQDIQSGLAARLGLAELQLQAEQASCRSLVNKLQQTQADLEASRSHNEAEAQRLLSKHAAELKRIQSEHEAEMVQQHGVSQQLEDTQSAAQERAAMLAASLKELQSTAAASAESRADLADDKERLERRLEDEQANCEALSDSLGRAQQNERTLRADLGVLKATLEETSERCTALDRQLKELGQRYGEALREIERLNSSTTALAGDLLESQQQHEQTQALEAPLAQPSIEWEPTGLELALAPHQASAANSEADAQSEQLDETSAALTAPSSPAGPLAVRGEEDNSDSASSDDREGPSIYDHQLALADMQQKHEYMERKLMESHTNASAAEERCKASQQRCDGLQLQLCIAEATVQSSKQALAALQQQLEVTQQERDSLVRQLGKSFTSFGDASTDIAAAHRRCLELTEQLKAAQLSASQEAADFKDLHRRFEELESSLRAAHKALARNEAQRDSMADKIAQLDASLAEAREDFSAEEAYSRGLSRDLARARAFASEADAHKEALQALLQEVTKQRNEALDALEPIREDANAAASGKVEDPQTFLVSSKDMSPTQPSTPKDIDTDLASQGSPIKLIGWEPTGLELALAPQHTMAASASEDSETEAEQSEDSAAALMAVSTAGPLAIRASGDSDTASSDERGSPSGLECKMTQLQAETQLPLQQRADMVRQLGEASQLCANMERQLDASCAEASALQEGCSELSAGIERSAKELAAAQLAADEAAQEAADQQAANSALQKRYSELRAAAERSQQELAAAQQQLAKVELQAAGMQAAMEAAAAHSTQELAATQQEVAAAQLAANSALQERCSELEATKTQLREELAAAQLAAKEAEEVADGLLEQRNEFERELEDAVRTIEEQTELEGRCSELTQQRDASERTAEALRRMLEDAVITTEDQAALDGRCRALSQQVFATGDANRALKAELTAAHAEIDSHKAQLAAGSEAVQQLRAHVIDAVAKAQELALQCEQLCTAKEALYIALASAQAPALDEHGRSESLAAANKRLQQESSDSGIATQTLQQLRVGVSVAITQAQAFTLQCEQLSAARNTISEALIAAKAAAAEEHGRSERLSAANESLKCELDDSRGAAQAAEAALTDIRAQHAAALRDAAEANTQTGSAELQQAPMQSPLHPLAPARNRVYTHFTPASAQAAALSPLTDCGSPKALNPSAFMHAAGRDSLSPMAAGCTPTLIDKQNPQQELEPPLPDGATPSNRAQWLATRVEAEMTQFCASLATPLPHEPDIAERLQAEPMTACDAGASGKASAEEALLHAATVIAQVCDSIYARIPGLEKAVDASEPPLPPLAMAAADLLTLQVIRMEDAIERLLLREVLESRDTATALSATDVASGDMSPALAAPLSSPGSSEVGWMYTPPGHHVSGLLGST